MSINYIHKNIPKSGPPASVKIIKAGSQDAPHFPEAPEKAGYRHPPKHSRFKKGQSGNPLGRPKKPPKPPALTPQDFVLRVLNQSMMVTVKGKRQETVVLGALVMKLTELALQGDMKAFRELMRLLGDKSLEPPRKDGGWTAGEMIEDFVRKLNATKKREE